MALACAAVGAAAAWSWQSNHYEALLARQALGHQADISMIGNASADQSRRLQEEYLVLQERLSRADESHYLELSHVQEKQKRLRDRIATADLRLSVLLAQPVAGGDGDVPAGAAAGGLVYGAQRGELDGAVAGRIVRITDDGDRAVIALGACQNYIRALRVDE
ncbi:lysis system i-spanin subunit Rz [Pseudomonas sp. dw_358]|uniref:lysis system i-spanin subunit Rz n=1 Tax=Pseudomonas sp. dw_358 TaxID=2720083 RepID=UPI001BD33D53|nr:lysis system i-spanin subunit Rz [Pseudomonas sp. dw_358]